MNTLLTTITMLILASPITCSEFRPDPVMEHIRKYGAGIDMTTVLIRSTKRPNAWLKVKGW